MAGAKTFSARHSFTRLQHPLSPCLEMLPALTRGKKANTELLSPVLTALWLDLSLSAAWNYIILWKENSRDIPLSKRKIECKLSALDH